MRAEKSTKVSLFLLKLLRMKDEVSIKFKKFGEQMAVLNETFLGYPSNNKYNFFPLVPFFKYPLNNIGDPFLDSLFSVNSKIFEREVLHFFAKLYKMPKNEVWGYVTHGGTEGNMYGLFVGREIYPDGIFYYSQDSHYSIAKIVRILKVKNEVIQSLENGEIDYSALEKRIQKNRNKPVILNLNIGTTMKGAIDDIDTVVKILKKNKITRFYIHCDAALSGMILPFIKEAKHLIFNKKPIASIAISGHKFIGTPLPCGVVLVKKEYVKRIERGVEYIGTSDTTLSGSRNGHAPLMLWYVIKTRGVNGFKKDVETCLQNAQYLYKKLQKIGYQPMLNKFSITVVFKKPSEELVKKWQLAPQGNLAHIVVMQHASRKKLGAFLNDLTKPIP